MAESSFWTKLRILAAVWMPVKATKRVSKWISEWVTIRRKLNGFSFRFVALVVPAAREGENGKQQERKAAERTQKERRKNAKNETRFKLGGRAILSVPERISWSTSLFPGVGLFTAKKTGCSVGTEALWRSRNAEESRRRRAAKLRRKSHGEWGVVLTP